MKSRWLAAMLFLLSGNLAEAKDAIDTAGMYPETVLCSFGHFPSVATQNTNLTVETIKRPAYFDNVKARSFIMPAALMAVGTYALFNEECRDFNELTRNGMWNRKHDGGFVPDHVTMFVPFVAYYGLNVAGVKSRHSVVDGTLMYTMASAITNTIVFTVKNRSAVERPDESDLLSFPSGHTAQAFVSAEFFRQEYGRLSPWYGVAGYAFAVGTGALRMRHNKHWLNDVVAGAGVGIAATRATYWLYPKIKKLVAPRANADIMLTPAIAANSFGLNFAYTIR